MKYIKHVILFVLILSFFLPSFANDTSMNTTDTKGLRGVWVATVVNIDYPSQPTSDIEVLKSEAIKVLEDAKNTGLNAVFLQIRPTADAFYASKIFPWSKYLTGTQGLAPVNGFDPLAFWVTEAHKRDIELHAWINPYRITKRSDKEPKHDFASLDPTNPARLNPGWVVKHSDGNLYFDPGLPEVRQLIVNSILEIIENYAVDGIHFDDYFYPDKSFQDQETFAKYNPSKLDIADWRRENVNTLIRDLSKAIKTTGKNIRFGISPFGIWANKSSNALGSDTNGLETYHAHYADTLKWVKEGLLDYIAPQIYWNIGFNVADYSKLLDWWKNAVRGTKVDLYIGHAAYKTGASDPASPWYGTAEIVKQLQLNEKNPDVKGSIFFSYKSFVNHPALFGAVKATYDMQDGKTAAIPVTLGRPSGNLRTQLTSFYLQGASDPSKPLYLNGQLVENRSSQGFFGILVPLVAGANSLTLSQEASYTTLVILRDIPSNTPVKMSKADIPAASCFPQSQEFGMAGEKITLSCKAPAGSKVTVALNGKTYTMKTNTATPSGKDLIEATYTYVYTLPSFAGTPTNKNLGTPVYTVNYKGTVKTQKAKANVGVIMKGSPYYAEVVENVIFTYQTPTSGGNYELTRGMVDSVTGMTGDHVRLSSGQWILKRQARILTDTKRKQPEIKKAEYVIGEKWDVLKLQVTGAPAAFATYDGKVLKIQTAATSKVTPLLPAGSLFSTATASTSSGNALYSLTIQPDQRIDGYYVTRTDSGLEVYFKRHIVSAGGEMPLTGLTIMLDPGHGGKETGAVGPMGLKHSEKDINLKASFKLKTQLESLGAKVLMTRTTDVDVSLDARLTASRAAKPDLFVSLHANAMPDNVDVNKIFGFSVYYREALSKTFSDMIYQHTITTLNRNQHGSKNKNFYVIRGTWTPSILLESAFVTNPVEFEWLTDENEQNTLMKTYAEAIVKYFTQ